MNLWLKMSTKFEKQQENTASENNSLKKEFSFFAELKSLIKRVLTPEQSPKGEAKPDSPNELAKETSEAKLEKPKNVKKSNSLEDFINTTSDENYNKVISVGTTLLHAIKGEAPKKELPSKPQKQQSMQ